VSPKLIREWWVNRWGYLSPDEAERFLAHPAIDRISSHARGDIRSALASYRHLNAAADHLDGTTSTEG
jgi:hypothetical protein